MLVQGRLRDRETLGYRRNLSATRFTIKLFQLTRQVRKPLRMLIGSLAYPHGSTWKTSFADSRRHPKQLAFIVIRQFCTTSIFQDVAAILLYYYGLNDHSFGRKKHILRAAL